jgi:Suppressor of fused protein (SUFU)
VSQDLESAAGWDAITARIESLYPGVEPAHRGMNPGLAFGSPLEGISAYRGNSAWHFVTYGLTELYTKESADSETSGWGYELTMRTPVSETVPEWPFGVLISLAGLTQSKRMIFGPGHRLQTGHPLAGLPTRLTAVAFTIDPDLGSIDTPHGRVNFLLVVGVTTDELERMKASSTAEVLAELGRNGGLVTDPSRAPT